MPTSLSLASFAPMQADKPYTAALCRRMPRFILLAFFGARLGIFGEWSLAPSYRRSAAGQVFPAMLAAASLWSGASQDEKRTSPS